MPYGFVKAKIRAIPTELAPPQHFHDNAGRRFQLYHQHLTLDVAGADWDVAINVGTTNDDDQLLYKLVLDFQHPVTAALDAAAEGFTDLTSTQALPALDYQRSGVMDHTGPFRRSDEADGSPDAAPIPQLRRLFAAAQEAGKFIYIFGHTYTGGDEGIHLTHMMQGGKDVYYHGQVEDDNVTWCDGGVLVPGDNGVWTAFFAAFLGQRLPTADNGDPAPDSQSLI